MGGIGGLICFKGDPPTRALVEQMSERVAYRGRRAQGIWVDGPAALFQRQMDELETGLTLPVEEAPLVCVVDGRLVDPGGLRIALEKAWGGPVSGSDPELILTAWQVWGSACLEKLKGDFALAVWNAQEQSLTLVRDRMGAKPLYTARQEGKIAFASDPRALLGLEWVSRELARDEVAEFLSFRYTHAPRTLLQDVEELPAGHLLRVDGQGIRDRRWWAPAYCGAQTALPTEERVVDRLRGELLRAVDRRLSVSRPTGILLSGGLSSAVITGVATRQAGRDLRTYNLSLLGSETDEAAFAGRVAKVFGTEHHTLRVEREEFVGAIDEVVNCMGQPVPSPAAISEFLLCRHAAAEVDVLLSGLGADEALAGPSAAGLRGRLGHRLGGRFLARRDSQNPPGLRQRLGGSNVFDQEARQALLRDPGLVRPGMRRAMLAPLYDEVDTDPVNQVLHVYQRGWLVENTLFRIDRVSMAAGVRVRYPMLDLGLLKLCASWPGDAKVKKRRGRWYGKWPLREIASGWLPSQLVWRPERGMPGALHRWLRGEGETFLWERVEAVCEDPMELFVPERIREMARSHALEEADWGAQLWTLLFLDAWWRSLRD